MSALEAQRFRARLLGRSTRDPHTQCLVWQGAADRHGYGKVNYKGRTEQVHRIAYKVLVGHIPDGLTLDHLCRTPRCWNTFHLQPVTMAVNLARGNGIGVRNARKTHCPRNHEYTEANTYRRARGDRECRACRKVPAHSA